MKKKCIICGDSFFTLRKNSAVCDKKDCKSQRKRDLANKYKRAKSVKVTKKCISCGKIIITARKQVKYCANTACQKTRERKWKEESTGKKIQRLGGEDSCFICGALFTRKSHNQKMCLSKECSLKKRAKERIKYASEIKKYSKKYYDENKVELQQKYKKWKEKHKHYRPPSYFNSKEYHKTRKEKKSYIEYCKKYREKIHKINNELRVKSEDHGLYCEEWDHIEDLELLSMKEDNMKWIEIAEHMKRTLFSVNSRYTYLKDIEEKNMH